MDQAEYDQKKLEFEKDPKALVLVRRGLKEKPPMHTLEGKLYRSDERWCDEELLRVLQQCSRDQDTTEWNEWRRTGNHPLVNVWLQGAYLWNAHLRNADLSYAHLEKSQLSEAHLEKATLKGTLFQQAHMRHICFHDADLWGADFTGADLANSHFDGAHLRAGNFRGAKLIDWNPRDRSKGNRLGSTFINANLTGAKFEGVDLRYQDLRGAVFYCASINGDTLIEECLINQKTNFAMVNLDAARIEPSLLTRLKTNIRRIAWKKYFQTCREARKERDASDFFEVYALIVGILILGVINQLPASNSFIQGMILFLIFGFFALFWVSIKQIAEYGITASLMKVFWWISDYGSSTKRVLAVFFTCALVFALAYAAIDFGSPGVLKDIAPEETYEEIRKALEAGLPFEYTYPQKHPIAWALQIGAFSISTMVTLGFGGINVRFVEAFPFASGLALILVVLNLLTGYFLLAVLVTRIGILFQSLGPEQAVSRSEAEGKP